MASSNSNWEGWKRSHGKLVQTPDLSTPAAGTAATGGSVPTLSIQEVQNAVNNGGNAAQTNVTPTAAAQTATPANAAQNAALSVNGVGNAGRGLFYGTLGAGGKAADPTAFLAAAPGAYQSPYAAAMQQTMNGLLNPTPFRYDVNADGLYQQIKDNYVKQGRQAMMDTQGQSAALTGGYGNSYGAMAGQQAYQESLGNLAGMIPELQQIAWQQYQQGQDDQRNNLEAMSKLDAQEYARWADEQEKYQELLKTLPAQTRAVMGGGYSGPNIVVPTAGNGKGKFVYDPNQQMALADYQKAGYITDAELAKLQADGVTIPGIDQGNFNYYINNRLGLNTYGNSLGDAGVDVIAGAAPVIASGNNTTTINKNTSTNGAKSTDSKEYNSERTNKWVFGK